MQAIILAGGFGTRLKEVIKDVPKPMADINNAPFLAYLISYLKNNGITDLVLSVGYLKEKIINYFGNYYLEININYAIEDSALGTGGAIINSLEHVNKNEPIIILNGDSFLKIDYKKLLKFHSDKKSDFTMVLRNMEDCSRYGKVVFDEQKIITEFKEKSSGSGYINGGIYILDSRILDKYKFENKFSFEQDFLNKNIKSLNSYAFVTDEYFIDIGIPEDYRKAEKELPKIINL
jgi:D-glycero-alpha-D-manno-heptose 1-phosphate guanylyltransferase